MSNDSTTNNFEEMIFPALLKEYDKILIPMIQRDYAQGRTDKKAQEVRTNLLNDIYDEKKKCVHFDLIFGSCEKRNENDGEKRCFIPVDGQQRLTTLFLLYLYAQNVKRQKNDWDLSKFSYDTRRAAADFCKEVTTTHWDVKSNEKVSDVIKNSVWFMNYWGNDPTVTGMLNMLDAIHEKAQADYFPNLEKVRFYFFDLESNGLNENLYLKMNSRGKPLTAFENLKASIEKILPNNIESDNPKKYFPENAASPKTFKDNWKFFMDRDWTNAFWNSEQPEETDKNITAFIVRFLSGYWNAFMENSEDNKAVADKLKEINNKNNYADFIPFEPIRESLELEYAFQRLALAFTTLVNKEKIKPLWNETIKTTDLHEYKIIAVVFAYVLFDGNSQAMRIAWNLAENTVSGYDNFIAYCKRIGEIYNYHEENKDDIYQILSTKEFNNPSAQLTEEIVKAKKIKEDSSWEIRIIEAENYGFFKGAIRFLFTGGNGEINWDDFDTKWGNAQKYFDKDGVKKEYQSQSILLRTFISKFKKWSDFWGFNYDNKISTWQYLLTSERYLPLNEILLYLTPLENDFASYSASLEDFDKEYQQLQESVQNDLVKTKIVEAFSSAKNAKLNWRYDKYCLYPANKKSPKNICVIADKRNTILSELLGNNTIECIQTINNCDFFWGWDINFKYNNHCFQWWRNPNDTELDVYLMKENWEYCERKVHTSDNQTDEDKYFCFRVTENISIEDFLKKLDSLIQQACEEEAGKDCFKNCPNEGCNHLS